MGWVVANTLLNPPLPLFSFAAVIARDLPTRLTRFLLKVDYFVIDMSGGYHLNHHKKNKGKNNLVQY